MYALATGTHGILLDIILAYFGSDVKRKMPGRGARPVDAGSTIQRPETTAAISNYTTTRITSKPALMRLLPGASCV